MPEVRRRFLEAIKTIRGTVKEAELRAALESGSIEQVMTALGVLSESQSAGIERAAVIDEAMAAYTGKEKRARELFSRAVGSLAKKEFFTLEDGCIDMLAGGM